MKQLQKGIVIGILIVLFVACRGKDASNASIFEKQYSNISIEIVQQYWPQWIKKNEGSISYARMLDSNDIIYRYYRFDGSFWELRIFNTKDDKDNTMYIEPKYYEIIRINNALTLLFYKNNNEYVFKNDGSIKKNNKASKVFKINNSYSLVFDGEYFNIVSGGKIILGYEKGVSTIVSDTIYSDALDRIYCYYYNDNIPKANGNIVKIEKGVITKLISDVRDFAIASGYFICINTYAPSEVPQIPQEGGYEEYSINVYDLDGKLIKNLDKELYDKYGMLAFPETISVNSSGYGVMSGSFVFNDGKEDEYGFDGLIIFKLVESK